MTDTAIPIPPPQPNDGTVNTESDGTMPQGRAVRPNRGAWLAILAVVAVAVAVTLIYSFTTEPQSSNAKNKKNVTPAPTVQSDEERSIDAIDVGDIDSGMQEIENDLNSL